MAPPCDKADRGKSSKVNDINGCSLRMIKGRVAIAVEAMRLSLSLIRPGILLKCTTRI
jgi:hypothetical protein